MTTITADYFHRPALPSRSFTASSDAYLHKLEPIAGDAASSLQAQASAHLARIARECAKESWDGYHAEPVTPATCNRVLAFLEDLPPWMRAPDIVPEADGEIAVEWYFAPNQTFSISIGEHGPLHYAGLFGHNEEIHGVAPFSDSIPGKILEFISDLLRSPAARRAA